MNFFDYYDSAKNEAFLKDKEEQRRKEMEEFMANPPRGGSALQTPKKEIWVNVHDN